MLEFVLISYIYRLARLHLPDFSIGKASIKGTGLHKNAYHALGNNTDQDNTLQDITNMRVISFLLPEAEKEPRLRVMISCE